MKKYGPCASAYLGFVMVVWTMVLVIVLGESYGAEAVPFLNLPAGTNIAEYSVMQRADIQKVKADYRGRRELYKQHGTWDRAARRVMRGSCKVEIQRIRNKYHNLKSRRWYFVTHGYYPEQAGSLIARRIALRRRSQNARAAADIRYLHHSTELIILRLKLNSIR